MSLEQKRRNGESQVKADYYDLLNAGQKKAACLVVWRSECLAQMLFLVLKTRYKLPT